MVCTGLEVIFQKFFEKVFWNDFAFLWKLLELLPAFPCWQVLEYSSSTLRQGKQQIEVDETGVMWLVCEVPNSVSDLTFNGVLNIRYLVSLPR